MNILTIIVTLLILQANGIIIPNSAWIITLITYVIKTIIETKKSIKKELDKLNKNDL